MFAADVPRALQAMRACIRRGGRIAIAVWGPARRNPGQVLRDAILRRFAAEPAPDPTTVPHPLRLARPGVLPRLLREAGFRAVECSGVRTSSVYPGLEDAVRVQLDTGLGELYRTATPVDRRAIRRRLERGLARYRRREVVRVPAFAWVAGGTR
jgi:hypothetical protein